MRARCRRETDVEDTVEVEQKDKVWQVELRARALSGAAGPAVGARQNASTLVRTLFECRTEVERCMRAYLTSLLRVQPGRGWLAYLTWWTMGHRQRNLQAGRGRHSEAVEEMGIIRGTYTPLSGSNAA